MGSSSRLKNSTKKVQRRDYHRALLCDLLTKVHRDAACYIAIIFSTLTYHVGISCKKHRSLLSVKMESHARVGPFIPIEHESRMDDSTTSLLTEAETQSRSSPETTRKEREQTQRNSQPKKRKSSRRSKFPHSSSSSALFFSHSFLTLSKKYLILSVGTPGVIP